MSRRRIYVSGNGTRMLCMPKKLVTISGVTLATACCANGSRSYKNVAGSNVNQTFEIDLSPTGSSFCEWQITASTDVQTDEWTGNTTCAGGATNRHTMRIDWDYNSVTGLWSLSVRCAVGFYFRALDVADPTSTMSNGLAANCTDMGGGLSVLGNGGTATVADCS